MIEPTQVEQEPEESTITIGEYDESEELDETFTEEEEDFDDESEEEY